MIPFPRIPAFAAALLLTLAASAALSQTSLPAGHPPMGAIPTDAAGEATLPPGHPPMDGAPIKAPPLNPNAPMPANHPPLDKLLGGSAKPVPASITVRALPGAPNGSPIINTPILVELYHQGIVLKKWDLTLNAEGIASVPDLTVSVPCQPMITITHKGLTQQAVGPILSPESPIAKFDMKVFEPTETRPPFTINMRHVIVRWADNGTGLLVTEMLSVSNPADKAWLGDPHENSRFTFQLPLPKGALNVQLVAGFDEQTSHIHKEAILNGAPLFPGQTQFRANYFLPAFAGKVALPLAAPADIGQMMVFLPADGPSVEAIGLEGGQPLTMGENKVRAYRASNIKSGESVILNVDGLVATGSAAAAATPPASKEFSAKNVAIGGALLLTLAGLGILFIKKPKPAAAAPAADSKSSRRKNRKGQTA